MNKYIFIFFSLTGFYSFCIKVQAQNLPNIQLNSLRAPADISIDGKANEWNNKFQAFNHATEIFYTIANDDKNLYLIVKATDPDVINKIVGGGVSFMLKKTKKDGAKNAVIVTYPYLFGASPPFFNLRGNKGVTEDTSAAAEEVVMHNRNALLMQKSKWIATTGIKGVDSVISAYNQDDIKVACLFNNRNAYILEMSIALNHIYFLSNTSDKFSYHIMLGGSHALGLWGGGTRTNSDNSPENAAKIEGYFAKFNEQNALLTAATDFWGEYTLAKKP